MKWLKRLFGASERPGWKPAVPLNSTPAGPAERPKTQASPFNDDMKVEWRENSFPLGAVGESRYQEALIAICGPHSRTGYDLKCTARLIAEPSNPYDANARQVVINGRVVGYLDREQAIRMNKAVAVVGRAGATVVTNAVICGGWRTNQHDEGHFGVKLAVPLRGDIKFVGYEAPPKPARPRAKPRAVEPPSEEALARFVEVVERLEKTEPMDRERVNLLRKKHSRKAAQLMLEHGLSYGQASGAPDHLNHGEDHFHAEIKRMDNDLGEQVRIFAHGLDKWFSEGDLPAPYYPYRIAVLLRKLKQSDLERRFLTAYMRHFGATATFGARYAAIIERSEKMGLESHSE